MMHHTPNQDQMSKSGDAALITQLRQMQHLLQHGGGSANANPTPIIAPLMQDAYVKKVDQDYRIHPRAGGAVNDLGRMAAANYDRLPQSMSQFNGMQHMPQVQRTLMQPNPNDTKGNVQTNSEVLKQLQSLQAQVQMVTNMLSQNISQPDISQYPKVSQIPDISQYQNMHQMHQHQEPLAVENEVKGELDIVFVKETKPQVIEVDGNDSSRSSLSSSGRESSSPHSGRRSSLPRSSRKRSRSWQRSSNRSHNRSLDEQWRDRDRYRDCEKDRERDKYREINKTQEKERLKKGLPPMKKENLSVCSTTLWVGHLSKLAQVEEISDAFGAIGLVAGVDVVALRGCAFVLMERRRDAAKAILNLHNQMIHGKRITVAWAPGKGVKGCKWKDYWEGDVGASYLPWSRLKVQEDAGLLNLADLEEGGMIDDETIPSWLQHKASELGKKPSNQLPMIPNDPMNQLKDETGTPVDFSNIPPPNVDTSQPPPLSVGPGAGMGLINLFPVIGGYLPMPPLVPLGIHMMGGPMMPPLLGLHMPNVQRPPPNDDNASKPISEEMSKSGDAAFLARLRQTKHSLQHRGGSANANPTPIIASLRKDAYVKKPPPNEDNASKPISEEMSKSGDAAFLARLRQTKHSLQHRGGSANANPTPIIAPLRKDAYVKKLQALISKPPPSFNIPPPPISKYLMQNQQQNDDNTNKNQVEPPKEWDKDREGGRQDRDRDRWDRDRDNRRDCDWDGRRGRDRDKYDRDRDRDNKDRDRDRNSRWNRWGNRDRNRENSPCNEGGSARGEKSLQERLLQMANGEPESAAQPPQHPLESTDLHNQSDVKMRPLAPRGPSMMPLRPGIWMEGQGSFGPRFNGAPITFNRPMLYNGTTFDRGIFERPERHFDRNPPPPSPFRGPQLRNMLFEEKIRYRNRDMDVPAPQEWNKDRRRDENDQYNRDHDHNDRGRDQNDRDHDRNDRDDDHQGGDRYEHDKNIKESSQWGSAVDTKDDDTENQQQSEEIQESALVDDERVDDVTTKRIDATLNDNDSLTVESNEAAALSVDDLSQERNADFGDQTRSEVEKEEPASEELSTSENQSENAADKAAKEQYSDDKRIEGKVNGGA